MIKKCVFIIAFFCFAVAVHAQDIPKVKMVDVVQHFEQKNDSIYVINFWATFCKPCVAEIPNFIKITNKYKKDKVKLMLVSLDLPSFYPKRIATNIAWLEETNADYFCPMIDKTWGGSIPATIIVNAKTGYRKFFEAEISAVDFEKELKKAIESKKDVAINKFVSPMNDAKISEHNTKLMQSDFPSHGITFKANDSTVYSATEGIVGNCIALEDLQIVIIEQQGISYFYSHLKNTTVKTGDVIKQNQVIGYAATEFNEPMYTLNFNLFKRSKQIELSKEDFTQRRNKSNDHSFDPMKEPE